MNEPAGDASQADWPRLFGEHLRERFDDRVSAIVLYGSWLRGKRDTVLDFYVLLDSYAALGSSWQCAANRLLAPNVYNLTLASGTLVGAAKYATLTLEHFERAVANDFHSYFWARFAQPLQVVYARSAEIERRIAAAREVSSLRMITETLATLPQAFTTRELWQRAFSLTYACELRSEDTSKSLELVDAYADSLESATRAVAARAGLQAIDATHWSSEHAQRPGSWRWPLRRILGKALSVARLFKAAFTFNQPLEYILWKVERHSGIRAEPSALQCRYPLLFAWGLLWRLYRRGGFR